MLCVPKSSSYFFRHFLWAHQKCQRHLRFAFYTLGRDFFSLNWACEMESCLFLYFRWRNAQFLFCLHDRVVKSTCLWFGRQVHLATSKLRFPLVSLSLRRRFPRWMIEDLITGTMSIILSEIFCNYFLKAQMIKSENTKISYWFRSVEWYFRLCPSWLEYRGFFAVSFDRRPYNICSIFSSNYSIRPAYWAHVFAISVKAKASAP